MRYNRQIILDEIGIEGQNKINNARILVIGAGGLGSPVLQYLTASGVGKIGIIDGDNVTESNLQRQVLFSTSDIGKNKAKTAQKKLEKLNPLIHIKAYPNYLTSNNALSIIENYDLVIDGTDNFSTRYLVNDACIIKGKILISASIFKFSGQISVFNLGEKGASYRCLFPTPPKPEDSPNCFEIGVLGIVPGIIGTLQASEALKIILGLGNVLNNKILTYNILTNDQTIFKFSRNKEEYNKAFNLSENFEDRNYDYLCGITTKEINQIENSDDFPNEYILLDVREKDEIPEIKNALRIPLSILENKYQELDKSKIYAVFCEKGKRSLQAINLLQQKGFDNLYNLKYGIEIIK